MSHNLLLCCVRSLSFRQKKRFRSITDQAQIVAPMISGVLKRPPQKWYLRWDNCKVCLNEQNHRNIVVVIVKGEQGKSNERSFYS